MTMMKTLGRLTLAATLMLAAMLAPGVAQATTVSKSFTTHSQASDPLLVFGGETFTFSVSGTFVGSVKLQKSDNGADYQDVGAAVGAYTATVPAAVAPGRHAYYRIFASTHTSGTIVTSLADVDDTTQVINNHKGVAILTIKDDSVVVGGSGLTGASIADAGVVTAKVASDAITTAKIADDAVASSKILNQAVATAKIADGAVVTAKIASQAVTTIKLYLDLPSNVPTCVTTSKRLGTCPLANCGNCQ